MVINQLLTKLEIEDNSGDLMVKSPINGEILGRVNQHNLDQVDEKIALAEALKNGAPLQPQDAENWCEFLVKFYVNIKMNWAN